MFGLISLATLSSGCKSLWSVPVSTRFERQGGSLLWVVKNTTMTPITVDREISSVYYWVDESYEINGETVDGISATPVNSMTIHEPPLVIPPGEHYEFTVQGVRPLRRNETATAWMRLESSGHDIEGRADLMIFEMKQLK